MSARAFATILERVVPASHPTGEGFWRNTYDVDDVRANVFHPLATGGKDGGRDFIQFVTEGFELEVEQLQKEGKGADLTGNVLMGFKRFLAHCMDFTSGRCEPSIDTMAEICGCARMTIIRWREKWRALGFIDWVRRTIRTGNAPGKGPDRVPTTNAYFIDITKMPMRVQLHIKQRMAKKGRKVIERPERKGSGPVPNKAQRELRKLLCGLKDSLRGNKRFYAGPAEMKAMDALLETLPKEKWAEAMFPGDPEAQRQYLLDTGQSPAPSQSTNIAPEPPPKNIE